MPTIDECRITVRRDVDESPDLSWLGEYSDRPGPCAIDRKEEGDWSRGEFLYFNPSSNHCPPGEPGNWAHVSQADIRKAFDLLPSEWKERRSEFSTLPELLDTYYMRQDYLRMERFNAGDWNMLCIQAEAKFETELGETSVSSGGLCGVESDSGERYLEFVEAEEVAALKNELQRRGVRCRTFTYQRVEHGGRPEEIDELRAKKPSPKDWRPS